MSREQGSLSINSENIFPIIKKWLYSDHDIFFRELVSNGSDAITKLKKLEMIGEAVLTEGEEFKIRVLVNPEEKSIKIIDNGIGMTAAEVKEYINQIAFSGAADFLSKYKDKTSEDQIIGHFGLGFYSAFMVAHKVTIDTLSWQEGAAAVHWESEEGTDFEMSDSERTERGTEITLYLNEESYEFSNEYRAKEILEKYCSFMPVPIYFRDETKEEPKEEEEQTETEDSVIDAEVAEDGIAAEVDKKESLEEGEASAPVKKGPQPLNDTNPLWTKHPNECTEEEYKEFYRKVFHDYREPLFWIHLNMDYPFNLKGILYFPKLNLEYESMDGIIKLYSNQVFIADNIKEVIPEFLLLLKGVIDCPDLPLNVSRSALQNDGFVKKISDYITKKVADKLSGMFKVERESYEKFWDDISPFIKFGCLKDTKFRDKINDYIIFKDLNEKYLTLTEYVDAEKEKHGTSEKEEEKADESSESKESSDNSESKENLEKVEDKDTEPELPKDVVYYVTDLRQQGQYINMFKEEDINAILLTHHIDQPFITQLEQTNDKIRFQRIDSDLTESFKQEASVEDESEMKEKTDTLTELFRKILNKEKLEVKVEKLKNDKISSIVTLSEENRRMKDMMKMYSMPGMGMDSDMFGGQETLILNANNELVKYILGHKEDSNTSVICEQLYDLAMLGHKPLEPAAMTRFVERSNDIMLLLTK